MSPLGRGRGQRPQVSRAWEEPRLPSTRRGCRGGGDPAEQSLLCALLSHGLRPSQTTAPASSASSQSWGRSQTPPAEPAALRTPDSSFLHSARTPQSSFQGPWRLGPQPLVGVGCPLVEGRVDSPVVSQSLNRHAAGNPAPLGPWPGSLSERHHAATDRAVTPGRQIGAFCSQDGIEMGSQ